MLQEYVMIRSYFFNAIKECNSLLNAISTFSLYFFIHFWYCDIFWDISGHDNYQLKSFWLLSIVLKIKTKFFPWTLKLQVLLLSSLLLCSVTLIWNPSTLSYHEFFSVLLPVPFLYPKAIHTYCPISKNVFSWLLPHFCLS